MPEGRLNLVVLLRDFIKLTEMENIYKFIEYIEEYRYFRETKGRAKIPKGESGIEFSMRVLKAFFEMIAYMDKKDANNAVLVCHGGVIMSLFSMLCNESDDIYYYHVDNGSGYKAHYNQYTKELIIIEKL